MDINEQQQNHQIMQHDVRQYYLQALTQALLQWGLLIPKLQRQSKNFAHQHLPSAVHCADDLAKQLLMLSNRSYSQKQNDDDSTLLQANSLSHKTSIASLMQIVLDGWARIPHCGPEADDLMTYFCKVDQQQQKGASPQNIQYIRKRFRPKPNAYCAVLTAWSKSVTTTTSNKKVGEKNKKIIYNATVEQRSLFWFQKMKKVHGKNKPGMVRALNCVLNMYANLGQPHKAQKLFDEIKKENDDDPSNASNIELDVYSYTTLMKAWGVSIHDKTPSAAQQKTPLSLSSPLLPPLPKSKESLPLTSTQRHATRVRQHIQNLLRELIDLYEQSGRPHHLMPTSTTYAVAMMNTNSSANKTAPQETEALLEELGVLYAKTQHLACQPSYNNYTILLHHYAMAGQPQEVERILMYNLHHLEYQINGREDLKPNEKWFTIMIDAYVKQRTVDNLHKAETILSQMEDLFLHKNVDTDDNENSGTSKSNIRGRFVGMSNYCYNSVMNGYSLIQDDGTNTDKIRNIIQRMHTLAKDHPQVCPDQVSYTTLMKSLTNQEQEGFDTEVLALLDRMEQNDINNDDPLMTKTIRPDYITYTVALKAMVKSRKPGYSQVALDMLDRMYTRGIKPDYQFYDALIAIYANEGRPDEAQGVLGQLEQNKHTLSMYTNAIRAHQYNHNKVIPWSNLKEALGLFQTVLERYKQQKQGHKKYTDRASFRPPLEMIHSIMSTVARSSGTHDKLAIIQSLVTRMEEAGLVIHRDVKHSNAILRAYSLLCCQDEDEEVRRRALKLALSTWKIMMTQSIVDSTTYKHLFQCLCSSQNDEETVHLAERIFEKCAGDGLVTPFVWESFQKLVPPSSSNLLQSISQKLNHSTADCIISFQDLPPEWTSRACDITM